MDAVLERPDGSVVRFRMELGAQVHRQAVSVLARVAEREGPVVLAAPSPGAVVGDLSARRVKLKFPYTILPRSP